MTEKKAENNNAPDQCWFIYILRCNDDTLYTGITNNLEKRLRTHNAGKASKYTRARLPVAMVYSEEVEDRSTALRRECEIKQLSRQEKLKITEHF
jgi:putative endonuclease